MVITEKEIGGNSMSTENVKKFYDAVSKDEALKQKFVELSRKYQGQQMDEAKVMTLIEQEALPLAAQMGYSFTMDDLKSYGEEMKPANMNCEMSDTEMEAVTGGQGLNFCIFVGLDFDSKSVYSQVYCLFLGYMA